MSLRQYEGKRVRLIDVDGEIFEGRANDYVFPEDNEPEGVESITLYNCLNRPHPIEFFANEIKSIEVI